MMKRSQEWLVSAIFTLVIDFAVSVILTCCFWHIGDTLHMWVNGSLECVFPGIPRESTSGMDFVLRYESLGCWAESLNEQQQLELSMAVSLKSSFMVVNMRASGYDIPSKQLW